MNTTSCNLTDETINAVLCPIVEQVDAIRCAMRELRAAVLRVNLGTVDTDDAFAVRSAALYLLRVARNEQFCADLDDAYDDLNRAASRFVKEQL